MSIHRPTITRGPSLKPSCTTSPICLWSCSSFGHSMTASRCCRSTPSSWNAIVWSAEYRRLISTAIFAACTIILRTHSRKSLKSASSGFRPGPPTICRRSLRRRISSGDATRHSSSSAGRRCLQAPPAPNSGCAAGCSTSSQWARANKRCCRSTTRIAATARLAMMFPVRCAGRRAGRSSEHRVR